MTITWYSFVPVILAGLNSLLQVFPAGSTGNTIVNLALLALQAFLPRIVKPTPVPTPLPSPGTTQT